MRIASQKKVGLSIPYSEWSKFLLMKFSILYGFKIFQQGRF